MINKFLDFVSRLNSTNAVVLTGIIISLTTAGRYQMSGLHIGKLGFAVWEPSYEWLIFCITVMGVATSHFAVKRNSDRELNRIKAASNPSVNVEQATVQAGDVTVQADATAAEVKPTTGAGQ